MAGNKNKKEESEQSGELYWNLVNQTMSGRKFGESVTEFFADKKRRDQYLDSGAISYVKPETFEAAENGELVGLRKAVKSKDVEIADLKNQLKKTPKSVRAAKEEIVKLEVSLKESADEVTKLKADLETATAPKGGN